MRKIIYFQILDSKKAVTMKVSEDLSTFGGRLYDSFKEKGFDLKSDQDKKSPAMKFIIADIIKNKIRLDNQEITENDSIKIEKLIRKGVANSSNFPNIDTSSLKFFCDYLNVSADYLLGFIEKPLIDSGLSTKAITKLKNMDSDSKELFNDMVEGNYIKDLSSCVRTFYSIGSAIHINADNQEDKKNLGDEVENIKANMLKNSGAKFLHKLAYDKKVFMYFMNNAVDIHNQKEKDFNKDRPADYLKYQEQRQKEFKESMLAIYDEIEKEVATK